MNKSFFYQLLLLSFLAFSACSDDIAEDALKVTPGDLKKEVIKGVEILYSDSAKIRVRITGPLMYRIIDTDNPSEEFTKGVHVDFFDEKGAITSTLKADYAQRFQNRPEVLARGNVVMTSSKNESMETDEIIWDRNTEKVYTRKFVMVKTPKETFWGQGFESNQDFTQWHINGLEGHINSEKFENGVK